ncbi:hypothetical protein [Granulicella rosea]|nr:hypothetical protein [Granulicella rosea]
MNAVNAAWETWRPETRADRDAVLLELEEVLTSPHFCNSKRYPALLRYIVESTLSDRVEHLKERTLGIEVFQRPPSYDTNTDTVVRYTAGEVRKRLSLYYHEHGRKARIQISLPAGSYVPEFLRAVDEPAEEPAPAPAVHAESETALYLEMVPQFAAAAPIAPVAPAAPVFVLPWLRRRWLAYAVAVLLVLLAGLGWRYHAVTRPTAMDEFWSPILRDHEQTLVLAGGVYFKPTNFSGVQTAGKDVEYPFVSMQQALALAKVSGNLERAGASYQMQPSASTALTDMRERPVVSIGGYNNDWTIRLTQPLRFSFAPTGTARIVDREHPETALARDTSIPYSSADDYALVARFRDRNTDSVVLVLAGLGRNGTEAAAQFVTSPHYMQLLRDQVGGDLAKKNVEVVLKVGVIEGKTGAPAVLSVHVW